MRRSESLLKSGGIITFSSFLGDRGESCLVMPKEEMNLERRLSIQRVPFGFDDERWDSRRERMYVVAKPSPIMGWKEKSITPSWALLEILAFPSSHF